MATNYDVLLYCPVSSFFFKREEDMATVGLEGKLALPVCIRKEVRWYAERLNEMETTKMRDGFSLQPSTVMVVPPFRQSLSFFSPSCYR